MNADLALLRELRARRSERDAIPMVLVLRDERDGAPPTPPPRDPADEVLAGRLDGLAASLAPTRRGDDLGVVEALLQTLAFADFTNDFAGEPG